MIESVVPDLPAVEDVSLLCRMVFPEAVANLSAIIEFKIRIAVDSLESIEDGFLICGTILNQRNPFINSRTQFFQVTGISALSYEEVSEEFIT